MRSKIISIILCVAVLGAIAYFLYNVSTAQPETKETAPETESAEEFASTPTKVSRAFVIKTAHDTEDFFERMAYESDKEYQQSLPDLIKRLESSSAFLKDEIADYYGATYFSKIASILANVLTTPFANNADFSTRVGKILTEMESAYPTQKAAENNENDPDRPMYYPVLDTSVNGQTTLGLLAVYLQQVNQTSDNSISVTVGGNLVIGDTILGAEDAASFKKSFAASPYPYPVYKLSAVLKTDTVSFANLESPLTDSVNVGTIAGAIKGAPSYAKLLINGGIEAVSLANNRILNYGDEGKSDTVAALKENGVSYSDEGTIGYYQTKIGPIAFLSYNIIDEVAGTNEVCYENAPKADIAAAKQNGAKVVIVQFNWVNSSKESWDPSMSQVRTVRAAIDNGANLVVGTHPDYMEGIEQYKGVSVIYSPGNLADHTSGAASSFIFQQSFSLAADGSCVPGQITLYPVAQNAGLPCLNFNAGDVVVFQDTLKHYSHTVRYGLDKKAVFTRENLNMIQISK